MKLKRTKKNIVVTGILNESLLDDVKYTADKSGCNTKSEDFMTKMIISGTPKQLDTFTKLWNEQ